MRNIRQQPRKRRRGAILLLSAFLMVVVLAVIVFAVDVGNIMLARTQLQAAADSAALAGAAACHLSRADMEAAAEQFAGYNKAGGRAVRLKASDIEYGTWETATRTFAPTAQAGNAVRVTTRMSPETGGELRLFFASIFGMKSVGVSASAVATTNPRDIAFVIDLSGSMNDDTVPGNTAGLNSIFGPLGYPTIGSELLNAVYDDFGFNVAYPNEPVKCVGYTLGVSPTGGDPLNQLMSTSGPLSQLAGNSPYKIKSYDSWTVRRQKAFSFVMDVEIPILMPAAKPVPKSAVNYNYWAAYLDDYYARVGYRSYMQFMMYYGRDEKPDGVNYTPLSRFSPDCPWHSEDTAGGRFSFPPREQPTHAARRAIIAALNVIKERNQNISDVNQRDWVSIVTFDKAVNGGGILELPLTSDYDAAMLASTQLQACGSGGYSTATEAGLVTARNHIKPQNQSGSGRNHTNKVVVLLTDGQPNLYVSTNTTINKFVSDNPNADFYSSGQYAKQAPLMQTLKMQLDRWYVYPVGVGLDTDYDFMDRMARMGTTANQDGKSSRGSGNPGDYEARMTQIFRNIITNPKLRLVQ